MASSDLRIVLTFSPEDQTWLRLSSVTIPDFFAGHGVAPASGDALRIGGRQFVVQARVWEHDGLRPVLRLLMGSSHAASDTVFG